MSLRYLDSHCHFDFAAFDADRLPLWQACGALGIELLVIPGVAPQHWARQAKVCADCDGVFMAPGLHPWWIAGLTMEGEANVQSLADQLQQFLQTHRDQCVAIGETGLDKAITAAGLGQALDEIGSPRLATTSLALQQQFLDWHIDMANHYQLPLIIHSVKTHAELLQQLKRNPPRYGGVIHAFSGSYEQAMHFVALGFYLGIGGTITYERARKTRAAVAQIPLAHLLLETDAPDMPLSGYQGQRNSPLAIPQVAQCLAQLRGEPLVDIARQTRANGLRLFGLAGEP